MLDNRKLHENKLTFKTSLSSPKRYKEYNTEEKHTNN